MKLIVLLLSLILLNGCTRTVYIEPEPIKTFFVDECIKHNITPNEDGGLDVENHIKLYNSMKCYKSHEDFYKKQLLTIRGNR